MILLLTWLLAETDTELVQRKKSEMEMQAAAAVRGALSPICLGRCELLGIESDVELIKKTQDAMPGFESVAKVSTEARAKTIVAHIAADQKLTASTRAGLSHAVRAALGALAPHVDVRLEPFDFPQPRSDAVSPIVISMPKSDAPEKQTAAPPTLAPEGSDPWQRLLLALADAAPWLLGLLLVLLALALLRRKPRPVVQQPAAAAETQAAAQEERAEARSLLVEQCRANRALKAAVVRRLLSERKDDRIGALLRLLGEDALLDFHGTGYSLLLPHAYASMRKATQHPDTLPELEALIADELRTPEPDARLYRLQTLEAPAFSAVVRGLPEKLAHALVLMAPAHLREAHVQSLPREAQKAFYAAALDAEEPLHGEALEGLLLRLQSEMQDKALSYEHARLAALGMGQDQELVQRVLQTKPLWADLAEELLVTEEDLLNASDEVIDALLISAPPDALIAFLAHAGKELRLRLQGKLPVYLRALYNAESERALASDLLHRARARVFAVFRRIAREQRYAARAVAK